MNRESLCQSLILWVNTFNLDKSVQNEEELSDGVIIAKILNRIAPNHFNDAWMSKIKVVETSDNWRLKASNLKKIVKAIEQHNRLTTEQHVREDLLPDVNAIGEGRPGAEAELGRLLQLVLGCAINCDNKQEHITNIMALEESVQQVVMEAIKELMTREPTTPQSADAQGVSGEQLRRLTEDLEVMREEKEELAQRCHQLDQQIASLFEEKSLIETENDRLTERLTQMDSHDDPTTPAGRRYQELQRLYESAQEDLFKTEAAKEDLRIKCELLGKEILELQQQKEELLQVYNQAQSYKDEIDILRHSADKVAKLETQQESYKRRLEELSDVKKQNKILEEKNTGYVNKNMEMEEEIRRLNSFRSQLELYKQQNQELQVTCSAETKRADKAEFEAKRAVAKLDTLQREKEHLIEENSKLKECVDDLNGLKAQKDSTLSMEFNSVLPSANMAHGDGADAGLVNILSLHPDIKERLLRFERENKQLKMAAGQSDDSAVLQSMLDDSNTRKQGLEQENRQLNQRLLELSAELEDIKEQQSRDDSSTAGADVRRHLTEQQVLVAKLENQLAEARAHHDEALSRETEAQGRAKELEQSMEKKQREMSEMEARYKQYLVKAKAALEASDPKKNTGSAPELLALRNQLAEKDQLIKHMEKEHDKNKHIREQEEKLMVTAWYNLSMQMHRCATEERLHSTGAGQSFLARQRQARTTPLGPNPHPNNTTGR